MTDEPVVVNGDAVARDLAMIDNRDAYRHDFEEAASELADLARVLCPYHLGVGDRTCRIGCHDEPSCITDGPWDDVMARWPGLALLLAERKAAKEGPGDGSTHE